MSRPSIVVIGAGLAGSLLCNELVEDADVTLLEIGERDRIHYPPVRFDRKKLGHVNTFCFGGGGYDESLAQRLPFAFRTRKLSLPPPMVLMRRCVGE